MAMAAWQPADDDVRAMMLRWGMPDDAFALAQAWYVNLATSSYFTKALMVPVMYNGERGVLLAVSTAQSNQAFQRSVLANQQGETITEPEWWYFQVWWYPGLALLNFSGITDSRYQGAVLSDKLGELLGSMCDQRRIPNWREKYCRLDHGMYRDVQKATITATTNTTSYY